MSDLIHWFGVVASSSILLYGMWRSSMDKIEARESELAELDRVWDAMQAATAADPGLLRRTLTHAIATDTNDD
jgi:hypothetical protein